MGELRFDGRVAVVTGAGRGLGRAYAHLLAARGAKVVVNDLGTTMTGDGSDSSTAGAVVAEIEAAGGAAVASTDSVATAEGAAAIVAAAVESFGRLDVLINNAGIVVYQPFERVDVDDLQRQLDVHLIGSFNTSRAAWQWMVQEGYGRIVMTASSAILGRADLVAYSSAKAGVIGLGRSLAVAGADHGIKVNMVSPFASTRMWPGSTSLPESEAKREWLPEQAAQLVAFLCHEQCSATGEIYRTVAGRVSRLFLGETKGCFVDGVEDIRDRFAEIGLEPGYFVPRDSIDLNERAMEIARHRDETESLT